jgi:hypothetical protein
MRKFRRRGRVITTRLSAYEVSLLASLLSELIEVLSREEPSGARPQPADEFEQLAQELEPGAEETVPEDPVLQRLFPQAYPDDPAAAAEFRRFTQRDLRTKKLADAQLVLQHVLQTAGGAHDLRIELTDADAWLRTLTSLRLAVSVRLGITDASAADELAGLDESDPRAFLASVYDWLGFAEETLVLAL